MSEIKKLEKQRDALLSEQKALAERVEQLAVREAAAPVHYNFLSHPLESPEGEAARKQREAAEQRLQRIENDLKSLNRNIAYRAKLATADRDLSRAQAEEKKASKQVQGLLERIQRIDGRIEHIRAEQDQAAESARHAEQEAAQQIAKATASGDEPAARSAQALMAKASEAVAKAKVREESNQPVISALEAEAAVVSAELDAAREEEQQARTAVRDALRVMLGAEWDQSVVALEAIGAKLLAQGVRYPLTEMKVPVFAPWLRAVTYDDLHKRLKWTEDAA